MRPEFAVKLKKLLKEYHVPLAKHQAATIDAFIPGSAE